MRAVTYSLDELGRRKETVWDSMIACAKRVNPDFLSWTSLVVGKIRGGVG